MDNKLFELWGNSFLSAAKGQKQMDEAMKWMSGFPQMKDLSAYFKMYGLEHQMDFFNNFIRSWQKVFDEYQKSFMDMATLMDLVPRKEYIALSRENQELRQRILDLEEHISHLHNMLNERVINLPGEGVKAFQDLITDQIQNYQRLLTNVTGQFTENITPTEEPVINKTKAKTENITPAEEPALYKTKGKTSKTETGKTKPEKQPK